MKSFLRKVIFSSLSLFFLSVVVSGVKIAGGFWTYALGGFILTLLHTVLRPILGIITLPINFISLGLFSYITNALLLYIVTVLIPEISIKAFTFHGTSLAGFVIPKFYFNSFFSYIVSSVILSLLQSGIEWIIKD